MPWWCSICTKLFHDAKIISATPCGHVFHLDCLRRWMGESETCPECKKTVSSSFLLDLYLNRSEENSYYENSLRLKNELSIKDTELRKFEQRCDNYKYDLDVVNLQLKRELQSVTENKNKVIEPLESRIAELKMINRLLNLESEHLNDVKTIVNGTQLEAEKVLSSYSSNASEENVAKKLASYCSFLKCELDRVTDEKKALESNLHQQCSNKNSNLTQLQKFVENLKINIYLLEKEKRDSSGYNYSKDTPSCHDEQEISMLDNIVENVDYYPNTVKFAENQNKIGVRIVEDEMPTTSKLVVLSSSSTLTSQADLQESGILSPMSKRKRNT